MPTVGNYELILQAAADFCQTKGWPEARIPIIKKALVRLLDATTYAGCGRPIERNEQRLLATFHALEKK